MKTPILHPAAALLGLALLLSAPATAASSGQTFTCHFGRYGTVVIDTSEPGTSIKIKGRKYPAQSGSYFYQSSDGDIAVYFGPGMRFWEYRGVRDSRCIKKPNRRR